MKKNIRVAMITQDYHPVLGGAQRQIKSLAPFLKALNIDIHILTRRYSGLTAYELVDEVPIHRLPVPGPKAIAALSFTVSALPLIQKLKPDIIHAHELLSPSTTAIIAKRLFDIPIVAKVLRGGCLGDLAKLQRKPFGKQRIATSRKWIDVFISISQEIDKELDQIGVSAEHRVFIPNGVDINRFTPVSSKNKQAIRTTLELPVEAPIAIFTGRLSAEKRLDQLVSLWPSVRKVYPDAQLLLLGAGNAESQLKETAEEGVTFFGLTEDVVPYLQASDIFILPSATEGLSNSLLEALSCGLPAIATTVGGATDVIEHKKSGWLIPPENSQELKSSLLTLLNDADLQANLSRNGRERIVQNYALPITAQRLKKLYQQLVKNHIVVPI